MEKTKFEIFEFKSWPCLGHTCMSKPNLHYDTKRFYTSYIQVFNIYLTNHVDSKTRSFQIIIRRVLLSFRSKWIKNNKYSMKSKKDPWIDTRSISERRRLRSRVVISRYNDVDVVSIYDVIHAEFLKCSWKWLSIKKDRLHHILSYPIISFLKLALFNIRININFYLISWYLVFV